MNYHTLVANISRVHQEALSGAAGAVNRHLLLRNWLIGAHLVEFEQRGRDRARYGAGLLKHLSGDLLRRGIEGASPDVLERMRLFYTTYPAFRAHISATVSRKFPMELPAGGRRMAGTSMRRATYPRCPTPLAIETLLRFSWSHFVELLRLDDLWKRARLTYHSGLMSFLPVLRRGAD